MFTLADKVVQSTDVARAKELRTVQEELRLASPNHAPSAEWEHRPFVDRFVFDAASAHRIVETYNALDRESKIAILFRACHPIDRYWIEYDHGEGFKTGIDVDIKRSPQCLIFSGTSKYAICCGGVSLPENIDRINASFPYYEFKYAIINHHKFPEWMGKGIVDVVGVYRLLIAAMASSRTTSVRHQHLPSPDGAIRKMLRKRLQRGLPWLSSIIVECNRPKTALHRGELRDVESFAGMRGHLVIGHWRLIANALEPYWVWVEGHDRGDRDLGWVQKTRLYTAENDQIRRGFWVPDYVGRKGERLQAERAV